MTDRFEIEVDTTAANEKWHVEVEENLKAQAEEKAQVDEKERAEQPSS
jgi:3-ketosteroid 9alpha-monooxygenase subunit A